MALQQIDYSVQGKSISGITYTYIIRVIENSVSIENNTSNITIQSILTSSYSGTSFNDYGIGVEAKVNNSAIYSDYKSRSCSGKSEHVYYTHTANYPHNEDGTLTLDISGRFWIISNTATYTPPNMSISSQTFTATPIARASSILEVVGNTLGSDLIVRFDRKEESYTHSLSYSFGSITEEVASDIGTEYTFTPPLDLANEIPNSDKGNLTLILKTFNGDIQIGSDQTKVIEMNIPDTVVPTIGTISISEYISNVHENVGVFVQSLSRLNLAIENAQGVYGSTIKSYKLTFDGVIYPSQSAISDYVKGSGELVVKAEVTDSRGRPGTLETTVNIVEYIPPKFTSVPNAERQANDATNVDITISGSVSSIKDGNNEMNSLSVYVIYKLASSSVWPSLSDDYLVETTGTEIEDVTATINGLDAAKSYDIRVYIVDDFKQTYYPLELGTEIVVLDINRNGLGVGKFLEHGALDVLGDIYSNGVKVALENHTHDYAAIEHTHDNYANKEHDHNEYATRNDFRFDVIVAEGQKVTSASWEEGLYDFFIGEVSFNSLNGRNNITFVPKTCIVVASDETYYSEWNVTSTGITKKSNSESYIRALYGVKLKPNAVKLETPEIYVEEN